MRKFLVFLATSSLIAGIATAGIAFAPMSQANAKVTKPKAPTISALSSSAVKKGKVNVKITITLPASNGGSKITGSKVTAGGKSCTIAKTKTSCTIKSLKKGKALSVYATSKNIRGFGSKSARVTYIAGASTWPVAQVAPVVADTPAASSPVTPVAPVVSPTCATGGTCLVGDTGPGGGIIYYVDNAGFSCGASYLPTGSPTGGLCKYLEVAPSGWNGGAEPTKLWAVSANENANISGIADDSSVYNNALGIGLGYKNSDLIVAQGNDATTAAGAARAYINNSKTDWYLPTTAELNLLCQWNRNVPQNVSTACAFGGTLNTGTGASGSGFVADAYWSSSEAGPIGAWRRGVPSFTGVSQSAAFKYKDHYVRPVRAF